MRDEIPVEAQFLVFAVVKSEQVGSLMVFAEVKVGLPDVLLWLLILFLGLLSGTGRDNVFGCVWVLGTGG